MDLYGIDEKDIWDLNGFFMDLCGFMWDSCEIYMDII